MLRSNAIHCFRNNNSTPRGLITESQKARTINRSKTQPFNIFTLRGNSINFEYEGSAWKKEIKALGSKRYKQCVGLDLL